MGVHRETVAGWVRAHAADRDKGLAAKPHPGRTPFRTADQEKQVLGWLTESPTKHGFRTDLWTAKRVAELVRTKLGVAFHPNDLREWLTERNHTPQKPARRAKQRKPEAIAAWLEKDWPRIKKRSGGGTPTSSGSTRRGCSSTRSSGGPGRCGARRR